MGWRRGLLASLAALALVAAGCTPSASRGTANRRVTPPPEPAPRTTPTPNQTPAAGAGVSTQARTEPLSAGDLRQAYQAVLQRYVDPIEGSRLTEAANSALQAELAKLNTLPMFTIAPRLLPKPTGNSDRDWRPFGQVYDAVVQQLPEWSAKSRPDWIALRAMLAGLNDSHTVFLTPQDVQRRAETSFAGIGVLLSRSKDGQPPLVSEVFAGSPAASAGVRRGDRIMAVDGQSLQGMQMSDAVQLIRGPAGSQVRVQVKRLSQERPLEFAITRARVDVPQVTAQLVGNGTVGYLRLRSFTDASAAEALADMQVGQRRGARGWIVDLRGNGGGSLDAVVAVAGAFLEASRTVVGYQVDQRQERSPLNTRSLGLIQAGAPGVVLVDQDSASGAEILAAALREQRAATLVGTTTAGSVGVAAVLPLPDGSAIQITEQRFVSPSGAQLEGVGVTPDTVVEITDADLEAGRDPQLARAAEVISQLFQGQPTGR